MVGIQTQRFDLRMPTSYRWTFGGIGVVLLSIGFYLFSDAESISIDTFEDMLIFQGIPLGFVIGGGLCLWFIRQPLGFLQITPEGLHVDTIEHQGLIRWSNMAEIGERTALGQPHLGIVLNDIEAFLRERHRQPKGENALRRSVLVGLIQLGLMNQSKQGQAMLAASGHTPIKKGASETEMLRWAYENYQAHLLFAGNSFTDYAAARATLTSADETARASTDSVPEPTPPPPLSSSTTSENAPPGYKLCPMCAEPVRQQARICRFCQHPFGD